MRINEGDLYSTSGMRPLILETAAYYRRAIIGVTIDSRAAAS